MLKLKTILTLLIIVAFFSLPFNALCAVETQIPIDLKVNDQYIKTDADPFLMNDTTFVPIRPLCEALGVDEVIWNEQDQSATIKTNNTVITLPIGKNYAYVNGKRVYLDVGIKLVSDRTFVPVRFVAENLNSVVEWNQGYYIVNIYKDGVKIADNLIDKTRYNTDEIFWLARIIEAESSGEPMMGKIAVGNVILNRVKSNEYPNSIYGVIFDDKNGVQFEPVSNGSINNTPSSDSIIAAKRALNGENYVGDSLYFLNPSTASSSWISNNRPYYGRINNHDFYL